MRFAAAELALVLRLFRADLGHQTKRIVLTVLAIAWGTISIVLLLSFGEGLKRSLNKGCRGMGEGIGVVWPGATTKAWMGLPSGRPIPIKEEDPELLRSRIPEVVALSVEFSKWTPITVGTKTINTRVRGVEPEFGELRNIHPQAGGRFLNDRDMAEKRIKDIVGGVAKAMGGSADIEYKRGYPATINTEREAAFAAKVGERVFGKQNVFTDAEPTMGGEDFSYMLQAKPGAFARLGQGGAEGGCFLHNSRYDFNDAVIPLGAGYLSALVEAALPVR